MIQQLANAIWWQKQAFYSGLEKEILKRDGNLLPLPPSLVEVG